MKKTIIATTIIFYCIFQLVSCTKSKNTIDISGQSKPSSSSLILNENVKYDTDAITDSDFALYSYDSSISIHRGDTIMEIKDKLGVSSLDKYGDNSIVRYQGTILCVRDEKYCEGFIIQPYDKGTLTFKTFRNIKIGSTLEQVKAAYGEPTMIMDGDRLVFYVYKKNGNRYSLLKEGEATGISTEYYNVQFMLSSDRLVSTITVGDFDFAFNRK